MSSHAGILCMPDPEDEGSTPSECLKLLSHTSYSEELNLQQDHCENRNLQVIPVHIMPAHFERSSFLIPFHLSCTRLCVNMFT